MSGSVVSTAITSAGLQPVDPTTIRAALVATVAATDPGYTADLPGSLIEDIASTDVASISLSNSFQIELVNSLAPTYSNVFLLAQLGQVYGVPQGTEATTTSVYLQFAGTPGFVVAQGFTVSDGNFQYIVQDTVAIEADGYSPLVFALASLVGSWAVPANTVTNFVTSVPVVNGSPVLTSVTNPSAGLPGAAPPTEEEYRAQVIQAGQAVATGMPSFLRTQLLLVPGVQANLIAIRQQTGGGWEIIVGGGDPYAVANAIFDALFDISTLVGSIMAIDQITQANPGVVTTVLNHGYTTGQVVKFEGVVGMTEVNGNTYTATVIDDKNFSIGVNTTGYFAYVSGGVLTPNLRNVVVDIIDYPDTYSIPIVIPPVQTVALTLTWNTTAGNPVNPAAVAQLGAPALQAYINALPVGVPMNLFEMQSVFQQSIANIIPQQLLTRMAFAVSINGTGVSPLSGTGIIEGDPESYFNAALSAIVITQG